jgi:hypothetical protein
MPPERSRRKTAATASSPTSRLALPPHSITLKTGRLTGNKPTYSDRPQGVIVDEEMKKVYIFSPVVNGGESFSEIYRLDLKHMKWDDLTVRSPTGKLDGKCPRLNPCHARMTFTMFNTLKILSVGQFASSSRFAMGMRPRSLHAMIAVSCLSLAVSVKSRAPPVQIYLSWTSRASNGGQWRLLVVQSPLECIPVPLLQAISSMFLAEES